MHLLAKKRTVRMKIELTDYQQRNGCGWEMNRRIKIDSKDCGMRKESMLVSLSVTTGCKKFRVQLLKSSKIYLLEIQMQIRYMSLEFT